MFQLSQRLSEFSYGYGLTREIESRLLVHGAKTVPFLPSLVYEKELGFDVAFDVGGSLLFLQFKLGSELTRYRHKKGWKGLKPNLSRPFWRFDVETSDPDGQYRTLIRAEADPNVAVTYAAPQFSDWQQYATLYAATALADNSLFVRPSSIEKALSSSFQPPGEHQVMYDGSKCFVRSEPVEVEPETLNGIFSKIETRDESLESVVERQFTIWGERLDPFVPPGERSPPTYDQGVPRAIFKDASEKSQDRVTRISRDNIFSMLQGRMDDPLKAKLATLGLQSWFLGVQMLVVTDS